MGPPVLARLGQGRVHLHLHLDFHCAGLSQQSGQPPTDERIAPAGPEGVDHKDWRSGLL